MISLPIKAKSLSKSYTGWAWKTKPAKLRLAIYLFEIMDPEVPLSLPSSIFLNLILMAMVLGITVHDAPVSIMASIESALLFQDILNVQTGAGVGPKLGK